MIDIHQGINIQFMKRGLTIILLAIIISSCQKQVDYTPQIAALNGNISALQKTRDSLSAALSKTNTTINSANLNLGVLNKSLDSVKTQLTIISAQLNTLTTQLTGSNANITDITTKYNALNLEYADLLVKLNAILAQIAIDPTTLTNGLLAYYPFSGNVLDSSGNGYNPTNYNATLTSDRFGNSNSAYSFNGTSEYIALPRINSLTGLNKASFSFWVKMNQQNSSGAIFSQWSNTNGTIGLNPGLYFGTYFNNQIVFNNYSGVEGTNASSQLQVSNWHHIVINFDGTKTSKNEIITIYINGNIAYQTVGTLNNSIGASTSSNIGARIIDGGAIGDYFKGVIDDLRIYNRVLTPLEISFLVTH
jgi:prefoldin subunit 5